MGPDLSQFWGIEGAQPVQFAHPRANRFAQAGAMPPFARGRANWTDLCPEFMNHLRIDALDANFVVRYSAKTNRLEGQE